MKQGFSTGLFFVGCLAAPALGQTAQRTAAVAVPTLKDQTFQHLDLSPPGDYVTLDVQHEGKTYLLELQRHSLRSPDFRVLVQEPGGGQHELEVPAPRTYRGTVYDDRGNPITGSSVAASQTDAGWNLNIRIPALNDFILVQPLGDLDASLVTPGMHVVYSSQNVLPTEGVCGADLLEFNKNQPIEAPPPDDGPGTLQASGQPSIPIAFDADVEYWQALGSDENAVVADIEGLMALIEGIYERDTQVTFEITTIIVRTGPLNSDPYVSTDPFDLINEMLRHWNDNQGGVRRLLAHLMTGKSLDGPIIGVAALGVICKVKAAYGLSESLFSGNIANRIALTAHELGHNFGSRHCDENILFECCTDCHIMCSTLNGCNGIGMPEFGQTATAFIKRNAQSGCVKPEPPPLALPFIDDFPSDPPDPNKWTFNDKGDIVARVNGNEPSEPASLKLDANKDAPGYQDDIRTGKIDANGAVNLRLSFMHQRKLVEVNEDLIIDYVANGVPGWTELTRLHSDGNPQVLWTAEDVPMPPDALHPELRIRFRIDANQADDRWFIDDVLLAEAASVTSGGFQAGQPTPLQARGSAPGTPVVFFYSLNGPGAGPCLGETGLQLGLAGPVQILDIVRADDRGHARTEFFVPTGTPAQEVFVQTVMIRPGSSAPALSDVVSVQFQPEVEVASASNR